MYEDGLLTDAENPTCTNSSDCIRPPLDMPLSRQSWIDKDYTDENVTPKVRVACHRARADRGYSRCASCFVLAGPQRREDGRGRRHGVSAQPGRDVRRRLEARTVEPGRGPGRHGRGAYTSGQLPNLLESRTRSPTCGLVAQLPHLPVATIPRGGANTSDHVDILGSTGLNEVILKVATGVGDEVRDNFVSRIREYAKKIRWDG